MILSFVQCFGKDIGKKMHFKNGIRIEKNIGKEKVFQQKRFFNQFVQKKNNIIVFGLTDRNGNDNSKSHYACN